MTEVLTRKFGEGDQMENTCDQQISRLPQSQGRHHKKYFAMVSFYLWVY